MAEEAPPEASPAPNGTGTPPEPKPQLDPQVTPSPVGEAPKPRMFTSLEAIVQAEKEAPAKPEPILVQWDVPVSEKDPTGVRGFVVETRFSPDPWKFGLRYVSEVNNLLREEKPDAKGAMQKTNPHADFVACAKEVVVSPTWLHNKDAVARLKETIPPHTFSQLKVDLEHAAGLTADFFARYAVRTMPMSTLRSIDSASASVSGNLPGAPVTPAP